MSTQESSFETLLSHIKNDTYDILPEQVKKVFFTSLNNYIQNLLSSSYQGYWTLTPQIQKLLETLPGNDQDQKTLVFKALMWELIDYQLKNNIFYTQSTALCIQAKKRFALIIKKHSKYKKDHYIHPNDGLVKDFALCTGKLISTGLTLYNITKFPKSYFLHNFKELPYFVSINAFGPMLEGHIDDRCYQLFNREGWMNGYALTSEIMRLSPNIKGIFGRSWYYDPILFNKISPELKFTSSFQLENGGKLLTAKATQSDINFATSRSQIRQHLYNEGLYMPKGYIIMWDRKSILRWAQTLNQH